MSQTWFFTYPLLRGGERSGVSVPIISEWYGLKGEEMNEAKRPLRLNLGVLDTSCLILRDERHLL